MNEGFGKDFYRKEVNCGLRGGTRGAEPISGVQRSWGPLGASEFEPSFQQFGVSETPSQGPLRAPERLPKNLLRQKIALKVIFIF